MGDRVDQIKTRVSNFVKMIKDLDIQVKDWKFNTEGTEAGTTVDITIKLLIPAKKK